MTDDDKALVERLREEADEWDEPKSHDEFDMRGMLHSTANRIEALSAENERLRNGLDAALNAIEFVRVRDGLMQDENDLCSIARAALGETK